ncbi:beta-ketoacyl synthase N-terminal-like domain-containing protein [Micromonospora sp. NPDC047730]|uniref:type I polyketide synthase n=1 Tax=Micromonospora sp. NPDC047730 TaxID=3364253 RepID=UPI0037240525
MQPEASGTTAEPIAIVGMACRFPGGVNSPAEFWRLLTEGRGTAGELPDGRWDDYLSSDPANAAALRAVNRHGSFLNDVAGFDAAFFGVSPREAELMDPQQRMTLEVSWEALEHAGIPPRALAHHDAGVFVGVGADDYGRRLLEDLPGIEARTGIGGAYCAVANRVSYTLDLRGPSLAVDTACSSSLVAIHLACQSLWMDETPVALAGGVMLMAGPGLTMVLDAAGATSPRGVSRSFDASADGYGRGEGCGMVVLKRLSDARRSGDRVLALIRGGGIHQDGRTNGIMAPSQEAQEHLLRRVYRSTGIPPASVSYVEAHGTGTELGDPMEAGALGAALGSGSGRRTPLLIGSVKTNIGHLEAGAGVAGVIKTVLALQHGQLPATLHLTEPNPKIDWTGTGLRVADRLQDWLRGDQPRRAGVSGYGYGGTIAHLILEEAPASKPTDAVGGDTGVPRVYPISAATGTGLARAAGRLAAWLDGDGAAAPLGAVGHTLAVRRSHLSHRAAVVAADRPALVAGLTALAEGRPDAPVSGVTREPSDSAAVWVFSGHGSQWIGMGRELLQTEPAFGKVLDDLDPVFTAEIGFSPTEVMASGEYSGVDMIQPLIYAMQVGLAAVWQANGVRPAAVIGHSVGEIAAAVVSGVLSPLDGARLVCRRSVLLRQAAGAGAMAMVALGFDEVAERLAGHTDVVAAIASSGSSTVVSGEPEAVRALVAEWGAEVAVRTVDSDVAFHSPQMDPLLAALRAAADGLVIRPPALPLYTTALPDPRDDAARDGAYWAANLRNPVLLHTAVLAAAADGHRTFLEVSPHPVVTHSIRESLDAAGIDGTVLITLRRNRPEQLTFLESLAAAHCAGVPVGWEDIYPGDDLAELPPRAWEHRPYWATNTPRLTALGDRHDPASHTLLGGRTVVNGVTPAQLWHTYLDLASRPYDGDHPVQGVEIVPAAVLLSTFLAAGSADALTEVALRTPVTADTLREIQVVRQGDVVNLASRLVDPEAGDGPRDEAWLVHTTARTGPAGAPPPPGPDGPSIPLDPGFVVERLAELDVRGMGFPWQVTGLARTPDGGLRAEVDAPGSGIGAGRWACLLDAALSIASVVFPGEPVLRMPAAIRGLTVTGEPPARVIVHARPATGPSGADTAEVAVTAPDGTLAVVLTGLRYGVLDGDPRAEASPGRLAFDLAWRPIPLPASPPSPHLVVLGDPSLARLLEVPLATQTPQQPSTVLVAPPPGTTAADASAQVLRAVRAMAALPPGDGRVWVVTRGVRAGSAASLGLSALWGLGRILVTEYPDVVGGIVDLPEALTAATAPALRAVLGAPPGPDLLSVDDGAVHAARLTPLDGPPVRPTFECRSDATYLITGGLGVLGLEVARWLVNRGARRLVLAGRTALPPRERWDDVDPQQRARVDAVRSLEAAGVTVRTLALDVADTDALRQALRPDVLGLPPVRGVVHAAGVVDNQLADQVDDAALARALRPKADGALALHTVFPPGTLDFLVLFSSAGHLLGLPGQAAYAAANAFLDGLARHRRAAGDAAVTSYAWTSWRGLGMSTSSVLIDGELAARGTADITLREAFRVWEYAHRRDNGFVAVLRPIPVPVGGGRPPLLADLTAEVPSPADLDSQAPAWADLDGTELAEHMVQAVRSVVAGEMKAAETDVDPHRPLLEMGLDSIMAVSIRRRLEQGLRLSLPSTLLWRHPTVTAVAGHLADLAAAGRPTTEPTS